MADRLKIVLAALVSLSVIIIGAVIFLGNQPPAPKREEMGTAGVAIDKTFADLGNMTDSDERSAVFTLTNTGKSVLRVWNIATSCMCTFATLKIGNFTTPEYGMSMSNSSSMRNWIGEIPAGEKAELMVIYRPKLMPVTGAVSRQVNFDTNDPANSRMEVSVTANVE